MATLAATLAATTSRTELPRVVIEAKARTVMQMNCLLTGVSLVTDSATAASVVVVVVLVVA